MCQNLLQQEDPVGEGQEGRHHLHVQGVQGMLAEGPPILSDQEPTQVGREGREGRGVQRGRDHERRAILLLRDVMYDKAAETGQTTADDAGGRYV